MKSANNKLTIIADVLLLLLFAAVLGFIIWRFGDLFGLTGDKNKFYIWLAGIMSFIFLRASWYFSRLYRVRRERRQSEEQGDVGDDGFALTRIFELHALGEEFAFVFLKIDFQNVVVSFLPQAIAIDLIRVGNAKTFQIIVHNGTFDSIITIE